MYDKLHAALRLRAALSAYGGEHLYNQSGLGALLGRIGSSLLCRPVGLQFGLQNSALGSSPIIIPKASLGTDDLSGPLPSPLVEVLARGWRSAPE
jgi:hypothetical protein